MEVRTQSLFVFSTIIFGFILNDSIADPLVRATATYKAEAPQRQPTSKIVRIGWVYAMANAPLIVAEKKGFFIEEGIKVKLKSYKSGPNIRKDMKSGALDIAYIGVTPVYHWYSKAVLSNSKKGLKSKIIAKVNYGQAAVIAHKKSKINKIEDIRGKTFAGVKIGSGMDVLLRGFVLQEKAGLNPRTDLNIITMKPEMMGSAIERKRVSAAFSWEPFTSKYLLRGNVKIILDVNKEIPRYPWYVIMATPKALRSKRPEIVKVLKAHIKAIAFLNSGPTAGDDIVIQAFGLTAIKASNGKIYRANEILALAKKRLGWQSRLTRKDSRFMQRLMNYSYNLGYLKKKMNVADILDITLLYDAIVE